MGYQDTYLLMGVIFLAIWLALFIWRKSTRKEMVIMSAIFAFAGPIADVLYTRDWWHPLTLTKTAVGPESILVAFMIGGIASVVYEDVFKKRLRIYKVDETKEVREDFALFLILAISAVLFFGVSYIMKFNSLIATITALLIPTIVIWVRRKDLIIDSLGTGVLLVIIASLVYTILEFLTPGWISAFWYFKNVPHIIVGNLPLDDLIWYFLAGLFIGPLYEYWQEGKLVKDK